jgi:polyisoprenoid-binding protein YceI
LTTETVTTPTTAPTSLTGDYDIDPSHSRLGFAAKHAMVTTVRGHFKTFTADVHLDGENIENTKARVEIEAASIDTGHPDRDAHVRNSDFLEVETYPKITFVSTGAEKKGDDDFVLHGDLTVKDTTKPVSIEFEKTGEAQDPWGNYRVGFEGKGKINRKDWGVSFNAVLEAGGVMVSEKITLQFDIAAVRRAS